MQLANEGGTNDKVKWIRVPERELAGENMEPYNMHDLVALVTWVENPDATAVHKVPYHGQFLVDIVVTEPNAVDIPSKTGDEFILVLKGALSLTTHATKIEHKFYKGEQVMIPAGWNGIFRACGEDDGCYSELAIVPGDYYDKSSAPEPRDVSPFAIPFPSEPGVHVVHSGKYILEVENAAVAATTDITLPFDEVVQVMKGTITLEAGTDSETFAAGAVMILPAGISGKRSVSSDYQALVARALK